MCFVGITYTDVSFVCEMYVVNGEHRLGGGMFTYWRIESGGLGM